MINKRGLKYICLVLIMLLIIPMVSHNSVNAASAFSIDLSATSSKNSGVYDVHAKIQNSGKNFTGTLRVLVRNTNYNYVGYDVDISIPAGSIKEYTVSVPEKFVQTSEDVYALILDKTGKKVYTEKFRSLFSVLDGTLLTGLLSDHPESLHMLDMGGKSVDYDNRHYTIKLQDLSLSDFGEYLSDLRILVIDDFDTSAFSEREITAIKNWVEQGGLLMLGTGAYADRVLSGFKNDDMIAVTPGESYEIDLVNDNSLKTVNDLQYTNGFSITGYNCVYASYGGGGVFVSPYSYSDLIGNTEQSILVIQETFKAAFASTPNFLNAFENIRINQYDLEHIQAYMEKPARTGSWVVAIIMIIYVVVVGPILYLILKGMNKREKIWVIIPCMSLIFLGFIFLISISVRVKGLVLKSFSIVDMDKGIEEAYIFGYNPSPKEWSVNVDSRFYTGTGVGSDSYSAGENADVSIKIDQKTKLSYTPSTPFDTCGFIVDSRSNVEGDIDAELSFDPDKYFNFGTDSDYGTSEKTAGSIDGKVTNNTGVDFDYLLISVGDYYQLVENVKNGACTNVDIVSDRNTSYGTYGGGNISIGAANQAYRDKNYDKSSELAALSLAYDYARNQSDNNLHIIGIVKQTSLTDKNDVSWKCYMKTIDELSF